MPNNTKLNCEQEILTEAQLAMLLHNGRNRDQDHAPVVKFFDPMGAATWLISEVDPDDPFLAFGLCDLGFGTPELGYVDLRELAEIQKNRVLGIERDVLFIGKHPMSVYAAVAREKGRIDENPKVATP